MTIFWTLAALLTALALGHVLPTLLSKRPPAVVSRAPTARTANLAILREQRAQLDADLACGTLDAEQHRRSVAELERRVLDEADVASAPPPPVVGKSKSAVSATAVAPSAAWKSAWVIGIGMPVFAACIYSLVGAPQAINAPAAAVVATSSDTENVSDEQVEALLKTLAERMEAKPDDVQGWTLLARTYAVMQRFPEANKAFQRATALAPQDAQLLVDHADVLAVLQNQRVSGEPARLVARALEIDPKNLKALALAGGAAFEVGNYAQAITYWTQARELAPPGTTFSDNLTRSVEDARSALQPGSAGGVPTAAAAVALPSDPVAAPSGSVASGTPPTAIAAAVQADSTARVAGRVSLSPALAGKVAPTDVVFIFARAAEGPRMPLAILRRSVADLPISFTLDDSMAMSPAMKLSNFPLVVVGARVSKSGNALPSAGDLSGQTTAVRIGTEGLQIVIDAVQP